MRNLSASLVALSLAGCNGPPSTSASSHADPTPAPAKGPAMGYLLDALATELGVTNVRAADPATAKLSPDAELACEPEYEYVVHSFWDKRDVFRFTRGDQDELAVRELRHEEHSNERWQDSDFAPYSLPATATRARVVVTRTGLTENTTHAPWFMPRPTYSTSGWIGVTFPRAPGGPAEAWEGTFTSPGDGKLIASRAVATGAFRLVARGALGPAGVLLVEADETFEGDSGFGARAAYVIDASNGWPIASRVTSNGELHPNMDLRRLEGCGASAPSLWDRPAWHAEVSVAKRFAWLWGTGKYEEAAGLTGGMSAGSLERFMASRVVTRPGTVQADAWKPSADDGAEGIVVETYGPQENLVYKIGVRRGRVVSADVLAGTKILFREHANDLALR